MAFLTLCPINLSIVFSSHTCSLGRGHISYVHVFSIGCNYHFRKGCERRMGLKMNSVCPKMCLSQSACA